GSGDASTMPARPQARTAATTARRSRLRFGRTRPGVSLSKKLMRYRLPEKAERPPGSTSDVASRRQRDERAAVALTQDPHQGREPGRGQELAAGHVVVNRKRDRVDAHAAAVRVVRSVLPVDLADDRVDRSLREVVAVDIQRDTLLRVVKRIDRREDALARRRVRKRIPVAQRIYDRLARAGRIRYPLVAVALEEILAHVVHDLDALHGRIDLERLAHLALHHVPRVLAHAAGRIDQKNDVFA